MSRVRAAWSVAAAALLAACALPSAAQAELELRSSTTYVAAPGTVTISVRSDVAGPVSLYQERRDRRGTSRDAGSGWSCTIPGLTRTPKYIEHFEPFATVQITEPGKWTTVRVPAARLQFGNFYPQNVWEEMVLAATGRPSGGCIDRPTAYDRVLASQPAGELDTYQVSRRLQRIW